MIIPTPVQTMRAAAMETLMQCSRCPGFMARDRSYDLLDDSGQLSFSAWRCVRCGGIIEEILASIPGGTRKRRRLRYAVRT